MPTTTPLVIAVSACLLGTPCRYDGRSKPCEAARHLRELPSVTVVPVCPEAAGGLLTPRTPSEIVGSGADRRVVDPQGTDRTDAFRRGAQKTLELVREAGCTVAVLKSKSPSCGIGRVYDGSFSGRLVAGNGVAAQLLLDHGVAAIDEERLAELWEHAGNEGIAQALEELTRR